MNVRVNIAKLPSDVNVRVEDAIVSYIASKNKRIIVKGPVVGINAKIEK